MKTYLLVPMIAVTSVAVLSGGCVSKKEYDELYALHTRANAEKDRLNGENANLRVQVNTLQTEVKDLRDAMGGNAQTYVKMQELNRTLTAELADLKARFKKLSEIGTTVNIGDVLPAEMSEALRALAAAHPDLIEYLPKYGMVKFKSDLTFELGDRKSVV
jgi:predicted nuclease with TOPRIM domain